MMLLACFVAAAFTQTPTTPDEKPVHLLGPFLGGVDTTRANIWCRAERETNLTLYLFNPDGSPLPPRDALADDDHDRCVTFRLTDLTPGTRYSYLVHAGTPPKEPPTHKQGGVCTFTTCNDTSSATIIFGSCAMDPHDGPQQIWSTMLTHKPTALCLIGDTPYIDTPKLDVQRKKYRSFFSIPEFQALRRVTPTFAIWDDHDFGENDTTGKMPGKEDARRAFDEYHSNFSLGESTAGRGIYHSFRQGPVEVFMLDARWYSNTEPSFADPSKPTLIGGTQWSWLKDGLKNSTAPFKLLVTGMVWNDAVKEKKPDYWGGYPHERAAIFKFIEDHKIPGVILVGGDVHRSRTFRYPTSRTGVSYPIYEIVASPLGSSVHKTAFVGDPDLLMEKGEEKSFCVVKARKNAASPEALLTVSWYNAAGEELFSWVVGADMLVHSTAPKQPDTLVCIPTDGRYADRNAQQVHMLNSMPSTIVFIGDSITEGWAGTPAWSTQFAHRAVNLGVGGDRTYDTRARLLPAVSAMQAKPPKAVVVLIGTNNMPGALHTPREIAADVDRIVSHLTHDLPETRVLLMSIFPRSPKPDELRLKIAETNKLIAKLESPRVKVLDIGASFLDKDGNVKPDLMPDYLHLSPAGYQVWADAITPILDEWTK